MCYSHQQCRKWWKGYGTNPDMLAKINVIPSIYLKKGLNSSVDLFELSLDLQLFLHWNKLYRKYYDFGHFLAHDSSRFSYIWLIKMWLPSINLSWSVLTFISIIKVVLLKTKASFRLNRFSRAKFYFCTGSASTNYLHFQLLCRLFFSINHLVYKISDNGEICSAPFSKAQSDVLKLLV